MQLSQSLTLSLSFSNLNGDVEAILWRLILPVRHMEEEAILGRLNVSMHTLHIVNGVIDQVFYPEDRDGNVNVGLLRANSCFG